MMKYTEYETNSISQLIIEALYKIKSVDDAMEEIGNKKTGMYRNFKSNVKDLEKILNGKTIHRTISCNWAEMYYRYLKEPDRIKFLDAMDRQVDYDSNYKQPSHKLKKWIIRERNFLKENTEESFYLSFSIEFTNINDFISHWSTKYNDSLEYKYDENINNPLTESSIMELFEWKNGSVLSSLKRKSVQENYPSNFNGEKESRYLNPNESGGAIWNIFYLHCLDPITYPIFDQHTLRAMRYLQNKEIINTDLINDTTKYQIYKNEYIPFIMSFKSMDNRIIDRALFSFGKFLKYVSKII